MATISTSIELFDKVSAPIYKMLGALDNLTGAFESVESSMDGTFDTSQIESARRSIEQAALKMVELGQNTDDSEKEQKEHNRAIHDGSSAMDGLVDKVKGLVGAYMGLQSVQKLVNLSDEMTQTTSRINVMNEAFNEINGTAMETDNLVHLIYQSAQNARGSFGDMAAVVAKFGNNARDAFSSQEEVVAFANLIQKQMTIAGASTDEASNAMLQLSQVLGSGVLRGDELNSIFEQAPNLIQSIADYMDVPIGKIREMAQDGQISADIVKNAIFAATDDINAQFEQMPMTWGQVWTTMKNGAVMQFQPVLDKINELANNEQIQTFAANAVGALANIATTLVDIISLVAGVAMFFGDNWSVIAPIIMGVVTALTLYQAALKITNTLQGISALSASVKAAADMMASGATFGATVAQHGFNAALLACPITWIIIGIIAVIAIIYAVIGAINKLQGTSISATGVIVGALMAAVAFIWNLFLGLVDLVLGCVNFLVNGFVTFANFLGNVFTDPIGSIIHMFGGMADGILGVLESIAKAMDKLFGTDMAGAVSGWRSSLDGLVKSAASKYGNGAYEELMDEINLSSEDLGLSRWAYSDAYDTGYKWGEGLTAGTDEFNPDDYGIDTSEMFNGGGYTYDGSGYDASQIPSNISETAGNTGSIADSMEITSEDLKYLRDIAEQEAVNRFTTAEIKVEMTNNNSVSSDMDLDGIVDYLANGVNEAMSIAAEGVH